jgi:hypothetical protein
MVSGFKQAFILFLTSLDDGPFSIFDDGIHPDESF